MAYGTGYDVEWDDDGNVITPPRPHDDLEWVRDNDQWFLRPNREYRQNQGWWDWAQELDLPPGYSLEWYSEDDPEGGADINEEWRIRYTPGEGHDPITPGYTGGGGNGDGDGDGDGDGYGSDYEADALRISKAFNIPLENARRSLATSRGIDYVPLGAATSTTEAGRSPPDQGHDPRTDPTTVSEEIISGDGGGDGTEIFETTTSSDGQEDSTGVTDTGPTPSPTLSPSPSPSPLPHSSEWYDDTAVPVSVPLDDNEYPNLPPPENKISVEPESKGADTFFEKLSSLKGIEDLMFGPEGGVKQDTYTIAGKGPSIQPAAKTAYGIPGAVATMMPFGSSIPANIIGSYVQSKIAEAKPEDRRYDPKEQLVSAINKGEFFGLPTATVTGMGNITDFEYQDAIAKGLDPATYDMTYPDQGEALAVKASLGDLENNMKGAKLGLDEQGYIVDPLDKDNVVITDDNKDQLSSQMSDQLGLTKDFSEEVVDVISNNQGNIPGGSVSNLISSELDAYAPGAKTTETGQYLDLWGGETILDDTAAQQAAQLATSQVPVSPQPDVAAPAKSYTGQFDPDVNIFTGTGTDTPAGTVGSKHGWQDTEYDPDIQGYGASYASMSDYLSSLGKAAETGYWGVPGQEEDTSVGTGSGATPDDFAGPAEAEGVEGVDYSSDEVGMDPDEFDDPVDEETTAEEDFSDYGADDDELKEGGYISGWEHGGYPGPGASGEQIASEALANLNQGSDNVKNGSRVSFRGEGRGLDDYNVSANLNLADLLPVDISAAINHLKNPERPSDSTTWNVGISKIFNSTNNPKAGSWVSGVLGNIEKANIYLRGATNSPIALGAGASLGLGPGTLGIRGEVTPGGLRNIGARYNIPI